MPGQPETNAGPGTTLPGGTCWTVALACLVPLLAISTQSFWIDEALTAQEAVQPTLAAAWRQMMAEKNSDLQMPLYMAYAWGWAKVFGTGEGWLRAANLPWFIGGVLAFALSFRGPGRLFAALMATLSSFAWFYLDEARPYAMQLGASLLIVASIRSLADQFRTTPAMLWWAWAFCFGVGVLAGTSLLGAFWCGPALLSLGAMLGRQRTLEILKTARVAGLALALWLAGLAAYYAWTMKLGARASAMGTTSWQNVFFVGYELLGFGGLGPGRLGIREAGLGAFRTHLVPMAVYGGFAAVLLAIGCGRFWRQDRRKLVWVGGVVLATGAFLLAAGWALHFRLLGRHCAPAQAAVLVLLAAGATEAARRQAVWLKLVLWGFLLVSAGSCLSARFAERHRKDDYRAAAAHARTTLDAGKTVWWSADPKAASFYGLSVAEKPEARTQARVILNLPVETVAVLPLPDVIVCSKPDLYDFFGAVQNRLTRERYVNTAQFTAFTVWVRSP